MDKSKAIEAALRVALYIDEKKEAFLALEQSLHASGWAIVPVEATEEMWQAGAVRKEMGDGVESIYRAMIAASKERTANE